MDIDFCAINTLLWLRLIARPKVTLPYTHCQILTNCMHNSKELVLTTLNLRSGYYYTELGKGSHNKTAFVTLFGKFEFNMVPFGLAQAPAYFQALINKVLNGLHQFGTTYLDDIIIFSKDEEEHLEHLRIIFQRLKAAGLKLMRS